VVTEERVVAALPKVNPAPAAMVALVEVVAL
jgi:hypothetical protein